MAAQPRAGAMNPPAAHSRPVRLRLHLADRSGGLGYHLRALRYRQRLWAPFTTRVAAWLDAWRPEAAELVLVGPSAGYALDAGFLARFGRIVVLEPDPLARWLLRRRFPHQRFERGTLDCLANAHGPQHLASTYPQAAVLFANILGQVIPDDGGAWRRALAHALADRHWASWHDVLSAAAAPDTPPPAANDERLDPTTLAARLWRGRVVVTDHGTLGLAGATRDLAVWRLTPHQWQVVEWGWHDPRRHEAAARPRSPAPYP